MTGAVSTGQKKLTKLARRKHDLPVSGISSTVVTRVFYILLFCFAFFVINDNWTQSATYENSFDYTGAENITADRVEAVNGGSTLARLALCVFGICLLPIPPQGKMRYTSVLIFLIALSFAYALASVLWSVNPRLTLQKLVVLTIVAIPAFSLARRLTLHELMIIFSVICIGFIGIGILAEFSLGNFRPYRREYRFVGTSHPNTLAGYGVVCCLTSTVFSRNQKGISWWSLLVFAIGFATLVLTRSRTSLAGFVFALVAFRFITLNPKTRILMVSATVMVSAMVGMLLAVVPAKTWGSLADTAAMGRTKDVSSLTGRLPLWEELFEQISEKPILGHGYLAFWEADNVERLSSIFAWEIPHGHNMYIDVILDGGFIGLVLFVLVLLVTLAYTFKRYLATRDMGVAFVFGFVIFAMVHGMGESLFKLHTFLMFMLLTSLLRIGMTTVEVPANIRQSSAQPVGSFSMPVAKRASS